MPDKTLALFGLFQLECQQLRTQQSREYSFELATVRYHLRFPYLHGSKRKFVPIDTLGLNFGLTILESNFPIEANRKLNKSLSIIFCKIQKLTAESHFEREIL